VDVTPSLRPLIYKVGAALLLVVFLVSVYAFLRIPIPATLQDSSENFDTSQEQDPDLYLGTVYQLSELDTASLKELGQDYYTDKNGVYMHKDNIYVPPGTQGSGDGGVVQGFLRLPGADRATFSILAYGWAKDAHNVYSVNERLPNADPDSFVIWKRPYQYASTTVSSTPYAKDKNNAYYRSSIIAGADPTSFMPVLDGIKPHDATYGYDAGYAKDLTHVYYGGKLIQADAKEFEVIEGYGKDATTVYRRGLPLALPLDPDTFKVVGQGLLDSSHVYFYDEFLGDEGGFRASTTTDPSTFSYVGVCGSVEKSSSSFYKDKNHVFVGDQPIIGADPATFVYFGVHDNQDGLPYSVAYAKDKNKVYLGCGGVLKDADPISFKDLKGGYAKDASHVWYLGDALDGADAATFSVISDYYGKDKNGLYNETRKMPVIPAVGSKVGGFTLSAVERYGSGDLDGFIAKYTGREIVQGYFVYNELVQEKCFNVLGEPTLIPRVGSDQRFAWFCFTNATELPSNLSDSEEYSIEIQNYVEDARGTEAADRTTFVKLSQ
jgi:hypothetical protein